MYNYVAVFTGKFHRAGKNCGQHYLKSSGAPNDSFLSDDALKRYLRLSGVPIKLCRFILGSAIIFLSRET